MRFGSKSRDATRTYELGLSAQDFSEVLGFKGEFRPYLVIPHRKYDHHTLGGALLVGTVTTAIAPWIIRKVVGRWNTEVRHYRQAGLEAPLATSLGPVALGAFFGTLSHLVLDGFIHGDMSPFAPLIAANPVLRLIEDDTVYRACAAAVGVGLVAWLAHRRFAR